MENKNTMDEGSFILEHIYWIALSMILYKSILLRCLEGRTFLESKIFLWMLIIAFSVIGIVSSINKRRNMKSIVQYIVIPFGIYTALAYFPFNRDFIVTVLTITAAISFMYIALVFLVKIKNKKKAGRVLKKRFVRAYRGSVTVFALGFAAILGGVGGKLLLGSTIMQAVAPSESKEAEYTLANNREELSKLKEEAWNTLSLQEKLDVLQMVAGVERNYLGISHELNVGAANLQEDILGYYKKGTHEIVLNLDHVMHSSSWEVVRTVCHESYHAYQYCLVEVYQNVDEEIRELRLFDSAETYEQEFANYIDGAEDLFGYASQECESDASAYAEEAVWEYYSRIMGLSGE